MSSIVGNIIGGGGNSIPKTYILQTEDGREIPAVLTEEEVDITATANDIRLGKIAVTENGVIEGTKVIPTYHTTQGYQIIPAGSELKITSLNTLNRHDYTKLQTIICDFNTSLKDSVSASKVVIDDNVYAVNSTISISVVSKNDSNKHVEFGITNETDKPQILRYFTYKEIE